MKKIYLILLLITGYFCSLTTLKAMHQPLISDLQNLKGNLDHLYNLLLNVPPLAPKQKYEEEFKDVDPAMLKYIQAFLTGKPVPQEFIETLGTLLKLRTQAQEPQEFTTFGFGEPPTEPPQEEIILGEAEEYPLPEFTDDEPSSETSETSSGEEEEIVFNEPGPKEEEFIIRVEEPPAGPPQEEIVISEESEEYPFPEFTYEPLLGEPLEISSGEEEESDESSQEPYRDQPSSSATSEEKEFEEASREESEAQIPIIQADPFASDQPVDLTKTLLHPDAYTYIASEEEPLPEPPSISTPPPAPAPDAPPAPSILIPALSPEQQKATKEEIAKEVGAMRGLYAYEEEEEDNDDDELFKPDEEATQPTQEETTQKEREEKIKTQQQEATGQALGSFTQKILSATQEGTSAIGLQEKERDFEEAQNPMTFSTQVQQREWAEELAESGEKKEALIE